MRHSNCQLTVLISNNQSGHAAPYEISAWHKSAVGRKFLPSARHQYWLCSRSTLQTVSEAGSPGREADHPPTFTAELKNAFSCQSTRLHGVLLNPANPSGHYTYHQVYHSTVPRSAHTVSWKVVRTTKHVRDPTTSIKSITDNRPTISVIKL